jgi:signal transduction histidine kinase
MEKSLSLALRMQSLVNGLLTLSRIESGQETLTTAEVDVARLLREAWSAVEARAAERGLVLRLQAPDSLLVRTSSEHLAMVLANLLDNTLAHGAAGDLDLVLERRAEALHLLVENRCDRKTPPAENLFEPFWRQDPSRTGERHFGLGLALCDRVVRLLGGTIAARQGDGRFTVILELPLASATAPPSQQAPRAAGADAERAAGSELTSSRTPQPTP